MKKKIIAFFLTIIVILSNTNVQAVSLSDLKENKIIEALQAVEPIKQQMGLNNINFQDLSYSTPILSYDYTKNGITINSEFIPIFYIDKLVGWVIKTKDGTYQFSVALVDKITNVISIKTKFAIIYDIDTTFIYDGKELYPVADISLHTENRIQLNDVKDIDRNTILLNNITKSYDLEYVSTNVNRVPVYYSCDVSFVSQNPPSSLCWAASVACVVNYLNNANLTATSVAQMHYGASNYDRELDLGGEVNVLNQYGVYYTHKNIVPSDGTIFNNIYYGYPVYATFRWSGGYHAGVIYAINFPASYLYVMDPEYGFGVTTYTASLGHRYVSGLSGVILTLDSATCKYWS